MTPTEFKTARQTLLAGFPKSEQRSLFGRLLGYTGKKPNVPVGEKERGERPISGSDEAVIRLLYLLRERDGHILAAVERLLLGKISQYLYPHIKSISVG